jgi:two-component system, cell cycle response regulator
VSTDDQDNSEHTKLITQKVELDDRPTTLEPYLIQVSGRETGRPFNLSHGKVVLGRDPNCEIPLDDPHISRHHAEITILADKAVKIRDLGSTNGIFVNGARTKEQILRDGDKILIGTRLYFRFCYQDSVDQNYQQSMFRAANIDALTQVYNKKYFMDALSKEFSFSKRNSQPLSLLMMDIDFFKKVNDTYGHQAGDLVLKTVGQLLLKSLRMENIACRYGGEEFAIILRHARPDQALLVAERLRTAIAAEKIEYENKLIPITISVGIATLEKNNFDTIDDLIKKADEHLYQAKEEGRNRTILKDAA